MIQGFVEVIDTETREVFVRLYHEDEVYEAIYDFDDIQPEQRAEMVEGSYVTYINGHIIVENVIYTTHDIETADRKAQELYVALNIS